MTGPVTLSFSELRALVTKSARGAGQSWGEAEEAGWAADWLARRGLPAADWAADWLAERARGKAGPVEAGLALGDLGQARGSLPDGLAGPGFLLPFLHRLTRPGQGLCLHAPDGLIARLSPQGAAHLPAALPKRTQGWTFAPDPQPDPQPLAPPAQRPQLSPGLLDCLETLALRTTVPPSDLSRGDAGARGGDND